jgi:uncharacterized protein YndB with AHSA1/START domain
MKSPDFKHRMTRDADPATVFDAIVDVGSWWSGRIDGSADRIGARFRYRYANLHDSTQQVTDLVPGRRIVWRVIDAHLSFVEDVDEWKGTEIVFEIEARGSRTELTFTHAGLLRSLACYQACSGGWTTLLTRNLRARIVSGLPQPDAFQEQAGHE